MPLLLRRRSWTSSSENMSAENAALNETFWVVRTESCWQTRMLLQPSNNFSATDVATSLNSRANSSSTKGLFQRARGHPKDCHLLEVNNYIYYDQRILYQTSASH